MTWLLLFSLVLVTRLRVIKSCAEDPQCYYGSKYLFESIKVANGEGISWETAEAYCKNVHGTSLASIHSQEDIVDSVSACKRSKVLDKCWIGLNDIDKEGEYKWSDNTAVDIYSWATGEPSGTSIPDENCVYISPEKYYKWNDLTCTGNFIYSNIKVNGFLCNNPDYNPDLKCHCDCDVCRVEGDPHITTFDGLLYHFMGPCSYLYVTPCFNNYNNLPLEISGSHVQCVPVEQSRTCLKEVFINLYDSNNQIAAQLKLGENYLAQWTGVGNLHWSGNVNFGQYINWNINNNPIRHIYVIKSSTGVLDVQFYWFDVTNHQIMDARIQVASTFDPNGMGSFVKIWLAECYAEDNQICGLCGLYDFNALNDFHYIDANNDLVYISTDGVSVVKTMTLDAFHRTNEFGNHWLNDNLTALNSNCTIIGNPPEQNCTIKGEAFCKQFWKDECPCPDPLYYNQTWLEGCIWDTCSLCALLDWSKITYQEALLSGCFAFANITCVNNCKNITTQTFSPTYRPTPRPTPLPTTPRPTPRPTPLPTPLPSPRPTLRPTPNPTQRPSLVPTPVPIPANPPQEFNTSTTSTSTPNEEYWWHWVSKPTSKKPTRKPTYKPTKKPTYKPTYRPTNRPTTKRPTQVPLQVPLQSATTQNPQDQDQYWWHWNTNNNNNKNKNGGH